MTKEDRAEMRLAAAAAVGVFPRVHIDPADVTAMVDRIDALEAALTTILRESSDGESVLAASVALGVSVDRTEA